MTAEESVEYGVKLRYPGGQTLIRMPDLVEADALVRVINSAGGPSATLLTRRVKTARYEWQEAR